MKRKPVKKEWFDKRVARLVSAARTDGHLWRIAPIVAHEAKSLLESYHGSRWAFVRSVVWEATYLTTFEWWNHAQIKFCDWMGWTKLYHYPETELMQDHWQRHGRKCSGSPNCSNMNCIEDSVPKWFKWLFRWRKL